MTKQVELNCKERCLLLQALGEKINSIIATADMDAMTKEEILDEVKPYNELREKLIK